MMERHGKEWLPDETQRLQDAIRAGRSIAEVAGALGRSERAIEIRAVHLGLVTRSELPAENTPAQALVRQEPRGTLPDVIQKIDELTAALAAVRDSASSGDSLAPSALAGVARAYDRYDGALLNLVSPGSMPEDADDEGDPVPDRLRAALIGIVRACVTDTRRHYICIQMLCLNADGIAPTLASIGELFERSRERVRQLRNKAFREIAANIPRCIGSSKRLRHVLADISRDTDWRVPSNAAAQIFKLVTDDLAAAEVLTFICCRVAGADAPSNNLRKACTEAVRAARNASDLGATWRFDRWEEAQARAIFQSVSLFKTPPADLVGLKRNPGAPTGSASRTLDSARLGRTVACESGSEGRVYRWVERSTGVKWYQEQPAQVSYEFDGATHSYFPDAAVMGEDGKIVIVEVKAIYRMYRHRTLAKALAALKSFGPRGMGYLLIDESGRTLADVARQDFPVDLAERIESLFESGPTSFGRVRREWERLSGRFDPMRFASMVVNRDWGVTDGPGVRVFMLRNGLSFHALRQSTQLRTPL